MQAMKENLPSGYGAIVQEIFPDIQGYTAYPGQVKIVQYLAF